MKKVKILVDGRWFDSFYSGVTTYLKGLYNALAQDANFSITIVGKDINKLKIDFPNNVLFIELDSKSNFKWLYFDIPRIIEEQKFDYAHFQYICPLNRKCKYIVTLHDLLFLDFKKSFPLSFIIKNTLLFYISAKRADILLTVSDYSKQRISYHFNIPNDKIFVTPNGILDGFSKYINIDINSKYNIDKFILFVSRVEPRKNHLFLLKAFVELKLYKNYTLVFIGKKTIEVKKLNKYLKILSDDILANILFLENVTEPELYNFYVKTSLFVYPSTSEGFGIPPIEAISSGAKTICSNATALSDFDFLAEYQFSPYDLIELKNKISYTLTNNNYPIIDFQDKICKKYSWNKIAKKFKKIVINNN
jgi:glycosyltransferase involved in cell wall biosynthesis